MKYVSALLLFAELLNCFFSHAQTADISRADTGTVIALLGPVARSMYDQFVGISVKTMTTQQDQVLDTVDWSSCITINAFQDLPILWNNLFGGQFNAKLPKEAERLKDLREADEYMSPLGNPRSQPCQQNYGRNRQVGQGVFPRQQQ